MDSFGLLKPAPASSRRVWRETFARRAALSAAAAFLLHLTSAAAAARLAATTPAPALAAWVTFCQQQPAECAVDLREPELVSLDPIIVETIDAVNRHVNHLLKSSTDMEHWGKLISGTYLWRGFSAAQTQAWLRPACHVEQCE
jgi:hypothetical protein